MDRTFMQPSRRWVVLLTLGLISVCGPGCSRMKSYRAQDSPLPGFPLIGRKARASEKSPNALARNPQVPQTGDVAWSGNPNEARPPASRARRPNPAPTRLASNLLVAGPDDPPAADPGLAEVRSLVQASRERLAKIGSYQVMMNRQERVGDALLPAENVLLSVCRQPRAIRLEWPDGPHKGREVIYTAQGGMMHINMADSKIPMPRMSLAPDSAMVMKNSRHPITEAGLDTIVDNLDASLKPHEAGTAGSEQLAYKGIVTPPETGRPCHEVVRVTARGETWIIDIDSETGMPARVRQTAANGDLLENYVFRDLVVDPPSLAAASAFDPDGRWGKPRGLFGRFASGANSATPAVR